MSTIKKNKKIARLKSNIWGNYYLLIGNKKVRDWKGKQSNKEEIESFLKENYPDYELKDLTEY